MTNKRIYYIDNLRWMSIMLLFPFHTAQLWNNWGSYYVWNGKSTILSGFVMFVNPWFMPLLFVIAGMSTKYALKKRTNKDFI